MDIVIPWARIASALTLICIVLIIASVVIRKLNRDECAQMVIPSYADTLRLMHDFRYRTAECRFTAQSIARYKIEALNDETHAAHAWANSNFKGFTDYALHSIVASDILSDPQRMAVFNDPSFVQLATDYDSSAEAFFTEDSHARVVELLVNYYDDPAKRDSARKTFTNMADQQLFSTLLHGEKKSG